MDNMIGTQEIQNLEKIVQAGRTFGNKVFIDGQAFFLGTADLKRALPNIFTGVEKEARGKARPATALYYLTEIDKLEAIVWQSPFRPFGLFLVNKQACLQQIEVVSGSLERIQTEIS